MSKNWNNGVPVNPPIGWEQRKETVALKAIRLFITARELQLASEHCQMNAQMIKDGLQGDDITEFANLHAEWKMAQNDMKRKAAGDTGVGRFNISVIWEG